MGEVSLTSTLGTEPGALWRDIVSPEGINREFRPFLRMTFPHGVDDVTARWRPGERICRSWILLAGVLPVEYDDIVFEEVEPGRRFLERSSMFTQRVWEHERTIVGDSAGSVLTDRVRFVPRWRWLEPLSRALVRATFRWRHRNLRRLYDGGAAGPDDVQRSPDR